MARIHLRRAMDSQRCGGWAFSIAWPSLMSFLSSTIVVPYPAHFFNGTKSRNSSYTAMWLAAAYEILGDTDYLAASESTAKTLMAIQNDAGSWPYGGVFPSGGSGPGFKIWGEPNLAPIQDHVQTYPIMLLTYLHQLTGKDEYRAAAQRGMALLLDAQNPNGSWPHEYDVAEKCGNTVGHRNGGEINDYATTEAMDVVLLMYRRTGNPEYLVSFLRGADWLVSAFIDEGAVGWAQQYDAENRPVQARHSEPPAVSMSEGIRGVPPALMTAYRLTGRQRYLDPLRKWFAWLATNRKHGGWYLYYDVKTGRPVRSFRYEITFIDDTKPPPSGKLYDPGIVYFREELDELERDGGGGEQLLTPGDTQAELNENLPQIKATMAAFDRRVGSWPYSFKAIGTCFHPGRWCVERLLWAILAKRCLRGQLPWSHRLAHRAYPEDWNIFSLLIRGRDLRARLTHEELARAEDLIAQMAQSIGPGRRRDQRR